MIGITLSKEQVERQVPKMALSLGELEWSYGSESLVADLRGIGALKGKRMGQRLLFDANEVARVWAEFFQGKYDEQLGM